MFRNYSRKSMPEFHKSRNNGVWILFINIAVKMFKNKKSCGHLEVIIQPVSNLPFLDLRHCLSTFQSTCVSSSAFSKCTSCHFHPTPQTYIEFFKGVPLPQTQSFHRVLKATQSSSCFLLPLTTPLFRLLSMRQLY